MKQLKFKSAIICLLLLITVFSHLCAQDEGYEYAYISIYGKIFTKKLKVIVDLGDSPEKVQSGKEYSETLMNKTSYAAILNFMVENKFELVETLEYNESFQGTGGTTGVVFIMRKKKQV